MARKAEALTRAGLAALRRRRGDGLARALATVHAALACIEQRHAIVDQAARRRAQRLRDCAARLRAELDRLRALGAHLEALRQRALAALERQKALAWAEEAREAARREAEWQAEAAKATAQAAAARNRIALGETEPGRHDARAEADRPSETRKEADTDRERLHPSRGWTAWPGNPQTAGAAREAGAGGPAGLVRRSPVARAGTMPHPDGSEVEPPWPSPDGEPPRRRSLCRRSDDGNATAQPRPAGPVSDFLAASEAGSPSELLEDLVRRIRAEGLEGVAAAMLDGQAGLLFHRIAEEQAFEEHMHEERRRCDAEWSRGRDPKDE